MVIVNPVHKPMIPTVKSMQNRLRIKQLTLIAALDEFRSLRKVAEAMHLSQPAATKMLHEIEETLGRAAVRAPAARHAPDRVRRVGDQLCAADAGRPRQPAQAAGGAGSGRGGRGVGRLDHGAGAGTADAHHHRAARALPADQDQRRTSTPATCCCRCSSRASSTSCWGGCRIRASIPTSISKWSTTKRCRWWPACTIR